MNRIAAIVGLVAATDALAQEARVIQIPSHPTYGQLIPRSISGDGRVVIGYGLGGGRPTPMAWTIDGEIDVCLSPAFGNNGGSGSVSSYDGSIVAGTTSAAGQVGFRWVRGGSTTLLTGLSGQGNLRSSVAISRDGSIVGGDSTWGNAAYWTAQGGVVRIPGIPGANSRTVSGMSADGQTMVGLLIGGAPFAWRAGQGSFLVPMPPGMIIPSNLSVTANGDALVGSAYSNVVGVGVPFIWNADTGSSILPGVPGQAKTMIGDGSADARIAVGQTYANPTPPYGDAGVAVFTIGTGTQYLADILQEFGLSHARNDFGVSISVSDDGMTIVGKNGIHPYWVVVLPQPELADYNIDRTVDFLDMVDYVDCYTGNSILPVSSADLDHDGAVDFFDYDEFVRRFE
ncbi:MAG: hypothetical protein AABZ53_07370 [Planctomycetota bacterium]